MNPQRKDRLGRGLGALLGDYLQPEAAPAGDIRTVPVSGIVPNPLQPRKSFSEAELDELSSSIRENGLLQPLVVRAAGPGRYELIAGERRLRAARLAGLTHIPAVVRESAEGEQLELALVENLQRQDLNAIEEAGAYRELIDQFSLSHEDVARKVGKSRVAISNALRLLDLTPETREAIADGRITEGHGRALAALTVPELQRAALQIVIDRHLSVRQTEELVRRKRDATPARRAGAISDDLSDLEAQLRGLLATRVGIVRTRRGGRLVIDFYSDEALDRLHAIIARGVGGGA